MSSDGNADIDQCTQESSNIIPSSEIDPPPPIVCFIPTRKPSIGMTPSIATAFDFALLTEAESQQPEPHRMFTQADDFQDLKDPVCTPQQGFSSQISQNSQDQSAYRLKNIQDLEQPHNAPPEHAVSPRALQFELDCTPTFVSPSDLPCINHAERIGSTWIKDCTFPTSQPRGSTPVHLTFMTSKPNQPNPQTGRVRASEPADISVQLARGDTPMESDPCTEASIPESTTFSSVEEGTADSKDESPLSLSVSARVPSDPTANADSDAVVSTSVSKATLEGHDFTNRRISVHISVMSSPMDCSFSQNESLILDGYSIDVGNLSTRRLLDRLTSESYRLFTRVENTLCSLLCSSDDSDQGRPNSKASQPATQVTSTISSTMDSKPIVTSSARTSSSSSDLFIPRAERLRAKRQFGVLFGSRIKRLRNNPIKIPIRSSSSAPDSSPSDPRQSSSINTAFTSPTPPETKVKTTVALQPCISSPVESGPSPQVQPLPRPLTRVLEATSEETEVPTSPQFPDKAEETGSCDLPESHVIGDLKDGVQSEHRNDESSLQQTPLLGTPQASDETLTEGTIPVYGKWHSEPYYYAGLLELPQTGTKRLVHFDDGSKAHLKQNDILFINLLPINCEVCADWSSSGEYWSDCVVEAHLMDSRRPYQVFCRINQERKALSRRDVSIHQSEVSKLRNLTTSVDTTRKLDVAEATTPESNRTGKTSVRSDVSLENVVFSKRTAKIKRYRGSWVTPITRLAARDSKPNAQSEAHDRRSIRTPLNQRSSNRTASLIKRSRHMSGTESVTRVKKQRLVSASKNAGSPSGIKEQVGELCTALPKSDTGTPQPASTAAPLPPNSSTAVFLRTSLSQLLGIPIRLPDIFANWTVVFTKPASSSAGEHDRTALEQLVLACGGQVAKRLFPGMLPQRASNEIWSPNLTLGQRGHFLALVSSDCCRTMKYFQALATLGRVPMLHTDWLRDACQAASTSSPPPPTDENDAPDTKVDWPLRILLAHPGQYELHRGYPGGSETPVSGLSVPPVYRLPLYRSLPPPSLFNLRTNHADLDSQHSIVAIVTDDTEVFGPAWSNILHLASGASLYADEGEVKPAPVLSYSEAPKRLSQILSTQKRSNKSLVLIDINELPVRTVTSLESLPCQLVTCDYFIQSLIYGYLVDPKDSPSFVPPLH